MVAMAWQLQKHTAVTSALQLPYANAWPWQLRMTTGHHVLRMTTGHHVLRMPTGHHVLRMPTGHHVLRMTTGRGKI